MKNRITAKKYLENPTQEDYERMVSQAHAAIAADPDYASIAHHQWLDLVHTVFASLGLLPLKGGK
jgi:hypothetical protein